MFIQTPYYLSHCCKFGACQKGEPAGRILGDFGNFLNGFAKSPPMIVLNIEWVQFVLNNCEMLHSFRGLYDKYSDSLYCFTSDVMYKKYKRFVGTILWSKHVERKKFGLIWFSRIYFPRLIYCDQETLRLLNVIENDSYIWVYTRSDIRLSTRCKMFHSRITSPLPQKPHECDLKLTDLWITSL